MFTTRTLLSLYHIEHHLSVPHQTKEILLRETLLPVNHQPPHYTSIPSCLRAPHVCGEEDESGRHWVGTILRQRFPSHIFRVVLRGGRVCIGYKC